MRRASKLFEATLVVVASLLFAAPGGAVTYRLSVFDHTDDGTSIPESYFWDVNESGVACGTATHGGTYSGVVSDLNDLNALYPQDWLRGINDHNRVAGYNVLLDVATGGYEVIPPVNDVFTEIYAEAVNNNDVVVGFAAFRRVEDDYQVPFVWDRVNGTRSIPIPGAKELLRINDNNVAVGNVRPSSGSSEAFVYDINSGTMTDLHRLLNPTPPGYSIASDINDLGVVTGEGWNGSGYRGFVWYPGSGFAFLPNLGGGDFDRVHPSGINDAGAVVGYALTGAMAWHGFIWDEIEGMRDLNDLVVESGGFVIDRALRVSDAGWIVGDGHWGPGPGSPRAFILVPADEGAVGVGPGATSVLRLDGHPNPFRGRVSVAFSIVEPGPVRLSIHDLAGRRVARLFEGESTAGAHAFEWAGRRSGGERAAAGIYFAVLETSGERLILKLVLER